MRAVLIGAGAIAREHLAALQAVPGVEVAGVCDLSPVMAEVTAQQFHVPRWFTDHRAMLAEVRPELVHVTTPPGSHARLATDALEAGAHVLVEKPITHDLGEMEALLALAERKGRLLVEDHNYLFNAPVARLLSMQARGELGELVHVHVTFHLAILGAGSRYVDPNVPHPASQGPGGAIADFVTHLAYLGVAFAGPSAELYVSWRKRGDSPLPADELRALMEGERGSALLEFSSHAQPDGFWIEAHGTRLRARASLFEPLLAIERLRPGPRPLVPVKNGLAVALAQARAGIGGLTRKLSGRPMSYEGLHELVRRTVVAIRGGGPPPVTPADIRAVNRLVHGLLTARKAA
ncbi:MAG TPA: Gfo/Idh/MocA family oxidoreductase [Planctomycetota bacterium]